MKNLLRHTVLLFICAVLLLTGCASTSKSSFPKDLFAQNLDNPQILNLLAPSFFADSGDGVADLKQQWLDNMSSRYDVIFNVVSNEYQDGERVTNAYSQTNDVVAGKTTFAGLVSINNDNSLVQAIQKGIAVPLEEYLAENPIWNALPEEIKSMFMMDGHIYAIPASSDWSMNARSIYTDSLEQTGIEVSDLNSLRDYVVALKKAATYQYVLGSTGLDNVSDILNAYGLYIDDYSGHPFSYDPAEDCIVDFLTKDSAIPALTYLRELVTAGAFNMRYYNRTNPYDDFVAGTCATYYGDIMLDEKYTQVFTLNPAYPQLLNSHASGYIMTKDTPQPKETINFFVNMLFGSEQNYLDCSLGLSDNYLLNSDGTITLKLKAKEDGSIDSYATPGLVRGLPGIFPSSDPSYQVEVIGTLTPELAASLERSNQSLAIVDEAIKQGRALKVPASYRLIHTSRFIEEKEDINYLYLHCVMDALIKSDYTVQEIVEQYRIDMLNMGGNTLLDEMNAAIGKETTQYYN